MSEKLEDAPPIHKTRASGDGLSELQLHFLDRLQGLVRQQDEYLKLTEQEDLKRKLLSRAVYANLTDCVNVGVGDQAHAIIEASRQPGY